MKRTFSILLSIYFFIGSMIPNGDFSQLTLLPDLMDHYATHQAEASVKGEEITFFEFLTVHYINTEGHQHDGEDHHPVMPMQHITSGFQFVFHTQVFQMKLLPVQDVQSVDIATETLFSSDFIMTTDRPPASV